MNFLPRGLGLALVLACTAGSVRAECVSIDAIDVPVTQDFDTLSASGTNNTWALPGWSLRETGSSPRANGQYAADTGIGTVGDTLSLGTEGSPERALGSLRDGNFNPGFGACFVNNTGLPISGLDIQYIGEQWRMGTASAGRDHLAFAYSLNASALTNGTWTGVESLAYAQYFDGPRGPTNGNDPRWRAPRNGFIAGLAIAPGASVWIRWHDTASNGVEEAALAIDDVVLLARGADGGGSPVASVSGVRVSEDDSGIKEIFFRISLDRAARAGGVIFDYATADGTATAGIDYAARSGRATINAGLNYTIVGVPIRGDTVREPDETFFLDITHLSGATAGNPRGSTTILDDDMPRTAIHAVQGAASRSPRVGQVVTVRGVVTAVKSSGIFVEATTDDRDGNDATSEAIYVATGVPVPTVQRGTDVLATGTVQEYVPASDPGQLPLTQLGGAVEVLAIERSASLPPAVMLTSALPSPEGAIDQLERYEGMRVTAPSFTVVAPTGGTTDETTALSSSDGTFHVVVTGVPRPFREPGIRAPDLPPSGSVPPIPRWDFNPELLAVASSAQHGVATDVSTGAVVKLEGPLDYSDRRYTLLPAVITAVGQLVRPVLPARLPTPDEFTVASFNVGRMFDTHDDPALDDPVLGRTAFEARLAKASYAIQGFLHCPDVIGILEVENIATLQGLAVMTNARCQSPGQPGQPGPGYVAHLVEGHDVDGLDLGLLVNTRVVTAGTPRVEVHGVSQIGADATWTGPDGTTSRLNDRPPLRLDATVHFVDYRSFPVTAILVHQSPAEGVEDAGPDGDLVRARRQRQAEFLADELQTLQEADPGRHVTVFGAFNAFAFNDGFVDAMGVLTGQPTPDAQTVVPGDGADLLDPDLRNLVAGLPQDRRYASTTGGNAELLDHVLVNTALQMSAAGMDLDHARINADHPVVFRNGTGAARVSGQDPSMLYVRLHALAFADLAVAASPGTAFVLPKDLLGFTVKLSNEGPEAAGFPGIGFAVDVATPWLDVEAPAGWTCDEAEVVGGSTSVACTARAMAHGSDATFAISAYAPSTATGRDVTLVAAATSQTDDPVKANNDDSASISVKLVASLYAALDGPDTLARNTAVTWTAYVGSNGPSTPPSAEVVLSAGVPAANVSLAAPEGWTCESRTRGSFQAVCIADVLPASGSQVEFPLTISSRGRFFPPRFEVSAEVTSGAYDVDLTDNASTVPVRMARP